ncbi:MULTISPECIES: type I glutamate--ammonia ligase [Dermacoccus]|uniref:type I glutamate--ammonia ligase n=1 Tax=Dermacoccus TaxID=57495 RepID=UPI0001E63DAA|nr:MULTISPECIES: type I glutamate--ammonia ligase [Dermacoccus]EFP58802.1 glutamine synthetase, beta-grasp domain protein [Dermacoccus sp. Ellin185]MCI0154481.1 type I glutamate--ammonia ligase [Dermacoccus nishinomiyaensis]TCJ91927.1 glutamine synthetase [Dermacoccus sp. SAI-028]
MNRQQEFVLRTIEERDIRFVRLWFTDVLGTLKSVAVAPAELEGAFAEGIGFDGSSIDGLARVYEADMLLRPDASTFQVLPWRGENPGTARMFADILLPDGTPSLADPRDVLRRSLTKAADLGFTFYTHPEIEFYLFEQDLDHGRPVPVDSAGFFDHVPHGTGHDFRRAAITMLENMGISVEFSHHEGGPGQNEIDLRYADALSMADNIQTFKAVIKEVALEQGIFASFMPKPMAGQPGSGMHTHLSLFEGDTNAFHEPGSPYQLSRTGRQFVAGLLHHAPEFTAITNQFVNSYKRIWGGSEAPAHICWGHNNRSAMIRIPMYKPDKGQSTRIEVRTLDAACNPYLAYAVMLGAGLKGIEQGMELPPEAEDDVWTLTERERRAMGIRPLPASLDEAIRTMEESDFVAEVLGEHVFDFVLRNKHNEWAAYRDQVTEFEIKQDLRRL